MSRKPRYHIFTDSQMYHVILRGNDCQNLFYTNKDRQFFINRLRKYILQLNIELYGFCLMDNHVHLVVGKANRYLSLLIQKIANSYVYYFNHKYEHTGHLFQGRFKCEAITDDIYFKTVLRYILQNPQNASMVTSYDKYKWNSYNFSNQYTTDGWIKSSYVCSVFSSIQSLRNYLNLKAKDKCMEYENVFFLTDSKAIHLINKLFKIDNPLKLKLLPIPQLQIKIRTLIQEGMSINQISRLTGINRHIIKTA